MVQRNFPKGKFYKNKVTGTVYKVFGIGSKTAVVKSRGNFKLVSSRNLRKY